MATGRSRELRWLVTALVLLGACRSTAPEPKGDAYRLRIEARAAGSFEGRGQEAWIRDVVDEGLAGSRWFRGDGSGPQLHARLRYEERATADGVPVLRVGIVVEPDATLLAALTGVGETLDAEVELERRDQTIELGRDLPLAVERALALLDAKVTVARDATDSLRGLLADADPEVVLIGLDGIERRRVHALGNEVVGLLEHPEERVVLRAVECLGAVGGPEHASALLRVPLADPAYANRLYEALANLGGEDAHGFLSFAARNEEDPDLARLAERALARLAATQSSLPPDVVARGHRQ